MHITSMRSQRGDTIIEVLIALSVLALILVAGYSISTRSITGVRVSQERSEALRVAESQLEQIRGLSAGVGTAEKLTDSGLVLENNNFGTNSTPPVVFPPPQADAAFNAFCIDGGSPIKYNVSNFKDFSLYSAAPADRCVVNGRYHVVIQPEYRFVSNTLPKQLAISYKVTVYWDRAGGGEVQSLSLAYKLTVPEI